MAVTKKNQLVGLDIGSHSIKLVEIDHTKKGRILNKFGAIGVPSDAIVEGSIKDEDAVAAAVRALFRNLGVSNQNVAVSLSGYSVFSKKITLAEMAESEIESAIHGEAEKYIPFDISDVNVDFSVLSEAISGKTAKEDAEEGQEVMDVMLVAAKTTIIEEYIHLFETAGINPCVLDVDIFAIQNATELSLDDPTVGHMIVHVGARELGINAVYGGVSTFSRDSSFGGAQITEAIMSEMEVDYETAERIKLGANGSRLKPEDEDMLRNITSSVVSGWVREVKQALDFVIATYPDDTIEQIILGGGSCRIPGFQQYLEMETGLPVTLINPFRALKINQKLFDPDYIQYMGPQAAVAVGLGLRSIGDK